MPELLKTNIMRNPSVSWPRGFGPSIIPFRRMICAQRDGRTWESLELKRPYAADRRESWELSARRLRTEPWACAGSGGRGYPEGFNDFTLMCFPDFVEVYGQDERHWDLSMAALSAIPFSPPRNLP